MGRLLVTPDDALLIQRALEVLQRQAAPAPSPTIAELHAQYAPWYKAAHPRSYKSAFIPRWRNLLDHFADVQAGSITLVSADEYRAARVAAAPETRNCELASLRACLMWAVKRRLIPLNPLSGLDREPGARVRTEFLDEAGFARLCAAAPNPMARALFMVAFDTGMRKGELLGLRRANVDLEQRLVRLGDADCKNGSGRVVPLTDRAVDVLAALPAWSPYVFTMLTGDPVGKTTAFEWFAAARTKSGIPTAMTFHGLRHSAATIMRRRGVPYPLIKMALGWKSEAAARRYQQFSSDDWSDLRTRMNQGIATEQRKPALKSVPGIPQSTNAVTSEAQGATKK